jgi:hypothetical protein
MPVNGGPSAGWEGPLSVIAIDVTGAIIHEAVDVVKSDRHRLGTASVSEARGNADVGRRHRQIDQSTRRPRHAR